MKLNCAFMFIISNDYGRKCLSIFCQFEPCNDMFKDISDIMAHWYEIIITIITSIAIKMNCAF